ncbi:MAG: molybdopterin molybdotransferase MoeA [Acidimicrobiales bacterium]|nr:molybdopterin molybdotransferase MoeA [Acidimicrobiales bacterium]HMS88726.1 molybdopterin molybdotransferase MoeA [Acidimicrobiales bacterium]
MIPFAEARAHVVERCRPLAAVPVPLAEALGCVLAGAEVAHDPVPPFANSAMDGYAVRSVDVADAGPDRPVRLRVVADLHAGHSAEVEVGPGCAVRIMTGAPMPPGADAVVVVERSTPTDDGAVLLTETAAPGRHVRPAGDDIAPGQEALAAGTVLTAAHLGVLAALGRRTPTVVPRPTVGILSTGDELVDDDGPLQPGQIRETNRPTLVAAAAGFGVRAVDLGTVPDDRDRIRAALIDAARHHDAVVTTGGVSMGDVDLVKVVLAEVADMRWMQVAIRPAKPFAFGVLDGTPVFGLPGNPVSSLVSLAVLGVPGLRTLAGRPDLDLPRVPVRVMAPVRAHDDGRTAFVRATARWTGHGFDAVPAGRQGSHQLAASAGANALLVLNGSVDEGTVVEAVLLRDPFGP